MSNDLLKLSLASIVAVMFHTVGAYAYLDPGTGSMVLQAIVGGIAVATIAIKQFWFNIAAFFGVKKKSNLLDEEQGPE